MDNMLRRLPARCIGLLAAALMVASCGTSITIPRPGTVPAQEIPAPEPSVVEIPVSVNLAPMIAEVEHAVPTLQRIASDWSVVSSNAVGDVGVKYELRRDPLQLSVAPNTFRVTSRVRYWFLFAQRVPQPIIGGSFWQQLGSCGVDEAPREAVLGLETRLAWTPDWALAPATSVLPTQFPNRCELTFLKFDVTAKVNQGFAAGLAQGAALADGKIRSAAQFKPLAERAWKELSAPVELDSGLWLVIDPQDAFVGPLIGNAQTATGVVGFTAAPKVILGARPDRPARSLPRLQPQGRAVNGFHVSIDGGLSYAEAGRMLTEALRGRTFSYLAHDVQVTRASVWSAGARAVVELALTGDVTGTIYLIGTPAYDQKGSVLYVRDLDYSLETTHALASTADWLLHGTFRSGIADEARWPLASGIDATRARLEKALNRPLAPNVALRASVSAIRPVGVYLGSDRFVARVAIDGALRVAVQ